MRMLRWMYRINRQYRITNQDSKHKGGNDRVGGEDIGSETEIGLCM